jgi:hypothetical protein
VKQAGSFFDWSFLFVWKLHPETSSKRKLHRGVGPNQLRIETEARMGIV